MRRPGDAAEDLTRKRILLRSGSKGNACSGRPDSDCVGAFLWVSMVEQCQRTGDQQVALLRNPDSSPLTSALYDDLRAES
jgi:hypothetical protein